MATRKSNNTRKKTSSKATEPTVEKATEPTVEVDNSLEARVLKSFEAGNIPAYITSDGNIFSKEKFSFATEYMKGKDIEIFHVVGDSEKFKLVKRT